MESKRFFDRLRDKRIAVLVAGVLAVSGCTKNERVVCSENSLEEVIVGSDDSAWELVQNRANPNGDLNQQRVMIQAAGFNPQTDRLHNLEVGDTILVPTDCR